MSDAKLAEDYLYGERGSPVRNVCFGDSGGFYALSSQRDRRHASAVSRLAALSTMVTTQLVVIEIVSLLTKRLSPFHARQWYQRLKQSLRVEIRDYEAAILS